MTVDTIAYPRAWRLVAGVLVVISRGSLPLLLGIVLFSRSAPILPLMLLRAFAILAVAPATAAWLIERAFATAIDAAAGALVLRREGLRVDIPAAAIARIDPWIVPLPGCGLSLRLRSGRRFRYGMQVRDPVPLLTAIADVVGTDAAQIAARHPTLRYADAKRRPPRARWYSCLLQYPVFALLPTLPLFRLQQYVTYGGTFGQYYQQGFVPYAAHFGLYWMTVTLYLVLYSAIWRGFAEAIAFSAAWAAPSRAARVRQAVETGYRILYYGSVPVLLIRYFLPW